MRSFCGRGKKNNPPSARSGEKDLRLAHFRGKQPLGLVTPTHVVRQRRQGGGFIRLCWNGKSGHRCVAAAVACGFITSKRRSLRQRDRWNAIDTDAADTDRRPALVRVKESRRVRTAALPAARFLLLPHSSADPGDATIFFLSRPWVKARPRKKKEKKTKQGHSDVIVSCLDNVFPNTYPSKQSQKNSGVGYFFFTFPKIMTANWGAAGLGIISSGVWGAKTNKLKIKYQAITTLFCSAAEQPLFKPS